MSTLVMNLCLVVVLFLVHDVHGYCMGIGANPGFTGAPLVQQVDVTTVLVSWDGLVTRVDCADQFLVKSGPISSPSDYTLSEMLTTKTFKLIIENRTPEIEYFYQVVAREDKGFGGVDYNKSPEARFTTSRRKGNIRLDWTTTTTTTTTRPVAQEQPHGESAEGPTRYQTEAPVASLKNEDVSFVNENLVWIIIGSLAAGLILIGLLYNIIKRKRGKDVDLDSDIGRDDDDDWADDVDYDTMEGGGGSELGEELKSLRSQD